MRADRVFACSDGGNTGVSIGGYDKERRPFIYVDFACGTWGGRPWADGLEGQCQHVREHGLALGRGDGGGAAGPGAALRPGGGPDGAGRLSRRRALPREYRFLEHEAVLQVRADRMAFRPYGLSGGKPGEPAANYLNGEPVPSKITRNIHEGDVFLHELAGGGGWGDPLDREPAAVARDVLNELLSPRGRGAGLRRRARPRRPHGRRGRHGAPPRRYEGRQRRQPRSGIDSLLSRARGVCCSWN